MSPQPQRDILIRRAAPDEIKMVRNSLVREIMEKYAPKSNLSPEEFFQKLYGPPEKFTSENTWVLVAIDTDGKILGSISVTVSDNPEDFPTVPLYFREGAVAISEKLQRRKTGGFIWGFYSNGGGEDVAARLGIKAVALASTMARCVSIAVHTSEQKKYAKNFDVIQSDVLIPCIEAAGESLLMALFFRGKKFGGFLKRYLPTLEPGELDDLIRAIAEED